MLNGKMIKAASDLPIAIRIIVILEVWYKTVILSLITVKIVESYFKMKKDQAAKVKKEYKWGVVRVLVRKVTNVRLQMLH